MAMSPHHHFPEHVRLLAIQCRMEMGGDMDAACSLFRDICPGTPPANVAEFINYWWDALTTRYSLLDEKHGRVSKLSDGIVERCLELLWEGYWCEGRHLAPLNLDDALANIPELARIREQAGLSVRTLWQHMKSAEPRLRQRLLAYKAKLSDAQRMDRWDTASRLRRYCLEELRRVVWIDATSVYVVPKGFKALVPPGADTVIEDDTMPKDYKHAIVLRFYCCVNAVVGPVAFAWHTGTTGFKPAKKYWVSAAVPASALSVVLFCNMCVTWPLDSRPIGVCW
jgi:hypothetical protein